MSTFLLHSDSFNVITIELGIMKSTNVSLHQCDVAVAFI